MQFTEKVDSYRAEITAFILPKIQQELSMRDTLAARMGNLEKQQARLEARKGELEAAIEDLKTEAIEVGMGGEMPKGAAVKLNKLRTDLELADGLLERCTGEILKVRDQGGEAMAALHQAIMKAMGGYLAALRDRYIALHEELSHLFVGYSIGSRQTYEELLGRRDFQQFKLALGPQHLKPYFPLSLKRRIGQPAPSVFEVDGNYRNLLT